MNRERLRRSLVVLALCGVLAAILLSHVPSCPLAGVFGVPCPGCGLTRATLALLHGDLALALHLHPLVFLLAPLFVWGVSSAAVSYVRGAVAHQPNAWLVSRTATVLASMVLVATLTVWGVRFLGYLGGPVPVKTFGSWAHEQRASRSH